MLLHERDCFMTPLEKDELFQNLSGFLKTKGIEIKEGSYATGIQKSCRLLSEAINLGHQGLGRAKTEVDKKLDQMRQVIHEKTAPKPPAKGATAAPPPSAATAEPPGKTVPPRSRARAKAKPGKSGR